MSGIIDVRRPRGYCRIVYELDLSPRVCRSLEKSMASHCVHASRAISAPGLAYSELRYCLTDPPQKVLTCPHRAKAVSEFKRHQAVLAGRQISPNRSLGTRCAGAGF